MKTPSPDEYRQTYLTTLAPHVPEPILAVGFLSNAGLMNSYMGDALTGKAIYSVSPLASRLFHKKKAKTNRETVTSQLVAVTATSVYLFDYPTGTTTFTVTAAPTEWRRSTIRVTADPKGRMTQRIHVDFTTGEHLEFDINSVGGPWASFSDDMRDLLLQPVAA